MCDTDLLVENQHIKMQKLHLQAKTIQILATSGRLKG